MDTGKNDIGFMRRALELSRQGRGFVNPNPLVGAVLVKNGRIIGEGYHEFFGGPHAEINALKNAVESAEDATLYVTLEPCSHTGKTPPCTEAVIHSGIRRVVAGARDPNPLVAGKGFRRLRQAGIEVKTGVLRKEIKKLNEIFFWYISTGLPFCAIKTAMTLDGKITTAGGDSKWITGPEAREQVHRLRHRYSSVMTGVETVVHDDPELTDRSGAEKKCHPVRIVVDSRGRIPLGAKVLNDRKSKTIFATTAVSDPLKRRDIEQKGAEIILCPVRNSRVDLPFLFRKLGEMGIDSVLVESGGELNFSLVSEDLVNKMYTFIAPRIFGGECSKTPAGGKGIDRIADAPLLRISGTIRVGDDLLVESYFKR